MRRGFFIGLGVVAVLLWWQPWRRWTQQGHSAERFDGRTALETAGSSGGSFRPHSFQQRTGTSADSLGEKFHSAVETAPDNSAQEAVEKAREVAETPAPPPINTAPPAAEASQPSTDVPAAFDRALDSAAEAAQPEDTGALGSSTDMSEFAAASSIPGMTDAPDTAVGTSAGDAAAASTLEGDVDDMDIASYSADVGTDTGASHESTQQASDAAAASSDTASGDDLDAIEGIGPKSSAILRAAGITTFRQIAEAEPDRLLAIVREGGITSANPTTWPMQAELAAEGKWDELKQLQDQIKNGRLKD